MKEIFAQRLLTARRQAGLSQDQLVARINGLVKKTSIAKYERGEMMPDTRVLEALAVALNQNIDYFFKPYTVSVTNVAFRTQSELGARKEDSLRHEITLRIEHYLELERLLNISRTFSNPLKGRLIKGMADAENTAAELLKWWNAGSEGIGNVLSLMEDNGIMVIEMEADEQFDGYSAWVNDSIPVMVLRGKDVTTERKRFTALHELAHLLFEFEENISKRERENLCHRFAGAMLMPEDILLREIGRYRSHIALEELALLKDKYGVSAKAMAVRAFQLEIISKFTYIKLLEEINTDKMEYHIGSNTRIDNSIRFRLLLSRALAEELISFSKAADLAGQSLDNFMNQYNKHVTFNHFRQP